MIDNFDLVKKQLKELAAVINEFKSEAVQMRVVELLFQKMGLEPTDIGESGDKKDKVTKKKDKRPRTSTKTKEKKTRVKRVSKGGRPGPGTMLNELIEKEFFKKPRVVQDIVNHCKSKTGYTYKTSELSVGLIRAIRNQALKRSKNDQKQWEYHQ